MNEREFLIEMRARQQRLAAEIEAQQREFDPSPAAITHRRKKILSKKGDLEFFAINYFPHYITCEPGRFHHFFFQRFPQLLMQKEGCIEWYIAPRGIGKTSLLTKIGVLFGIVRHILQDREVRKEYHDLSLTLINNNFFLLLGAEEKSASGFIFDIKTELEANANLAMDFPEITGIGEKWTDTHLITRNNFCVRCRGAGQSVRGITFGASRPQIIIGDDLITDEEARSPTHRENRWNWFINGVCELGPNSGAKILTAATVLDSDDPVSRAKNTIGHVVHHFRALETFPQHMELWNKCKQKMLEDDPVAVNQALKIDQVLKREQLPSYQFYLEKQNIMDRGSELLWPGGHTLFGLMQKFFSNPRSFYMNQQGEDYDTGNTIFQGYQYFDSFPPEKLIFYGACDPSMGKGDPSALIVGAFERKSSKLFVIDESIQLRDPLKLLQKMIALHIKYNIQIWAFENNNSYEYMRTEFMQHALKDNNLPMPISGMTATVPQEIRIESLQPYIVSLNPNILFSRNTPLLEKELNTWPKKQSEHHYDGLVALQLLWTVAIAHGSNHAGRIKTSRPREIYAS